MMQDTCKIMTKNEMPIKPFRIKMTRSAWFQSWLVSMRGLRHCSYYASWACYAGFRDVVTMATVMVDGRIGIQHGGPNKERNVNKTK